MSEQVFTWAYDAPTGVYKDHALAGELLKIAALKWRFMPFTKKITEYKKGMGQSITLLYYKALAQPSSAQLDERTRVPIDEISTGKTSITVKEWGRGAEYTSLAQDLGKFNHRNAVQEKLIEQADEAMDNASSAEFTGTDAKLCFIPTSLTGGTWDTDGTPSTSASQNVNKNHLGVIRDYMAKDVHVPTFDDDFYIGLFSTKALRGLKNDRCIDAWMMYLRHGDKIYKGEIGKVENIRISEVVNENALSNAVGTSSVLGEAVVFGKDAVGRIELESPHLRAQPNYQGDFGRRHAVAWYGVLAFGVLFPTANDREARIVKIKSA